MIGVSGLNLLDGTCPLARSNGMPATTGRTNLPQCPDFHACDRGEACSPLVNGAYQCLVCAPERLRQSVIPSLATSSALFMRDFAGSARLGQAFQSNGSDVRHAHDRAAGSDGRGVSPRGRSDRGARGFRAADRDGLRSAFRADPAACAVDTTANLDAADELRTWMLVQPPALRLPMRQPVGHGVASAITVRP